MQLDENTTLELGGLVYSDSLLPSYGQYYEFNNQEIRAEIRIEFESENIFEIYLVKSEEDYNKFMEDDAFEIYDGCLSKTLFSGEIICVVSSGGLVVYNPNLKEINYTIRMYG